MSLTCTFARAAGVIALICLGLVTPEAGVAAPLLDCPLRDARFSIDSPLIDVLLSDRARAVVESELPGSVAALPNIVSATSAPAFSSIVTLRGVLKVMHSTSDTALQRLEGNLSVVPVTVADKQARCARYDNDRAKLSVSKRKVRALLFEKMTGFRDTPSVLAANAAFRALAERNAWSLTVTDKGGSLRSSELAKFNVIIWNNVSGDVLTLSQRAAFRRFIEGGGGFVGVHGSAGDPVYFWDWYPDNLIGARFIGHPSEPQFQPAHIVVEPNRAGIGRGLDPNWTLTDEWYSFARSPRLNGAEVVARIDERSYNPGVNRFGTGTLAMGSDHPIAWTRCVGRGRAFYSAIGHLPATYGDPTYLRVLEQAITWASGITHEPCHTAHKSTVVREER